MLKDIIEEELERVQEELESAEDDGSPEFIELATWEEALQWVIMQIEKESAGKN